MTGRADTSWKTPDEIIRLQRLKQKQKALQARLERPAISKTDKTSGVRVPSDKRKNPFLDRRETITSKKLKNEQPETSDCTSEDSIFNLLSGANAKTPLASANRTPMTKSEVHSFANLLVQEDDANDGDDGDVDEQTVTSHVPVDWGLKTKLRILSNTAIPGARLISTEEASGITGFVRCMDSSSSTTRTEAPAALFHQSTMYWQYPHLPWLTLFPRMSKANNGYTMNEAESTALTNEWVVSFRALFHMLRARHCPYFYLCANQFTVLFRAAGIGGRVENHALITPTTRGFRAALKQEDIEFTMPLKSTMDKENANKSLDSGNDTQSNSFTAEDSKMDTSKENTSGNDDEGVENESDDEDEEKWLASLGVDASEIKKISTKHARRVHNQECAEDSTDQSLVLVEGVECQALFNFLLNAKSTTSKVGRLAGIPPTLLGPVAFPGAALRTLQVRASTVRMDDINYYSMELKGVILPHILHYLCNLMRETKEKFSATMVNYPSTKAMSTAAQKLMEHSNKENKDATLEHVFGRESLSDCGLQSKILEDFCRISPDAVRILERICYSKDQGGYTWA